MRKKFLSALMLGLLALGTTSTITSCKDYDDDIATLKTDITSLQNEITALQASLINRLNETKAALDAAILKNSQGIEANAAEIASLKIQIAALETKLEACQNECRQKLADLEANKATKAEVEAAIAAVRGYIDEKIADEALLRDAVDQSLQHQIVALDAAIKAIENDKLPEITSKLEALRNDVTALQTLAAQNKLDIDELKQKVSDLSTKMDTAVQNINILLAFTRNITSMVYAPAYYCYGFGVIDVMDFSNNTVLKATEKHETLTTLGDYEVVPTNELNKWAPNAIATYWLNPSNAEWEKYSYSFVDLETQNITSRGYNDAHSIEPKAEKVSLNEAGQLQVELGFNADEMNDAINHKGEKYNGSYAWVSTVALQASHNDTTVTSDYAILLPVYYKDLKIANSNSPVAEPHVAGTNANNHVHTTAAASILDPTVSLCLPYDETMDLNKVVKTCATTWANNAADEDKNLSTQRDLTDEEFAASGLSYDYSMVSYYVVDPTVDQGTFAKVENGVLSANDKAAHVGETVVVRVCLKDGKGAIVAVGYLKVLITDHALTAADVTEPLYLNCGPISTTISLDKIAADYTAASNEDHVYTAEEFMGGMYVLAPHAWKANNLEEIIPGVVLTVNTVTKNFVVTFSQEAWEQFYYENGKFVAKDFTGWAKFASVKPGVNDAKFQFTVKAEDVIYAKDAFTNDDKLPTRWYSAWSNNQGWDEMHCNVSTVFAATETAFAIDLNGGWVGGYPSVDGIDPKLTAWDNLKYANFELSDKNEGVEVQGVDAKYVLHVSADKHILYAQKFEGTEQQAVVLLTKEPSQFGNTGHVALYQNTPFAKDILNKYERAQMGENETFTAWINMTQAEACVPVMLDNAEFAVRFIRPINVEKEILQGTVDAVNGGGVWKIWDLVKFTDWRGYNQSDILSNMSFYSFYGITEMVPNVAKATTDEKNPGSGVFLPLSQVDPNIELIWNGVSTYSILHPCTIRYVNNLKNTNETFFIKVPVRVYYFWGALDTELTLQIDPTM